MHVMIIVFTLVVVFNIIVIVLCVRKKMSESRQRLHTELCSAAE